MINTRDWLIIFLSFVVAFMMTLLPMPSWAVWVRPAWILMVIIFWASIMPYRVNVGIAWLVGIFLDVLNGTLIGEHALGFTIVTYLVVRMHTRFCMYPLIQQGLSVFIFVLVNQFIIFCVQGFIGDLPRNWLYWSPAVTSLLLWPWVSMIMQDCRRRFNVSHL